MATVFPTPYYVIHSKHPDGKGLTHTCYGKEHLDKYLQLLEAHKVAVVEITIYD